MININCLIMSFLLIDCWFEFDLVNDQDDICDGTSTFCKARYKSGDVCRASRGDCDREETCPGIIIYLFYNFLNGFSSLVSFVEFVFVNFF